MADFKALARSELVLQGKDVRPFLREGAMLATLQPHLTGIVDDVQQLLLDALGLFSEIGDASEQFDRAHWDLPSISDHHQNRHFHDWTVLIELLRDAWLEMKKADPALAQRRAADWWSKPYPVFKRLALFAAGEGGVSAEQWVEWLVSDRAWWLWSLETHREVLRLLVLQGNTLTARSRNRFERAAMAGSPQDMFSSDKEPSHWEELEDGMVWLRLAKFASSGAALSQRGSRRLAALAKKWPDLQLEEDFSDEFTHWMSGTGDPGFESQMRSERAPRELDQLLVWLQIETSKDPFVTDDWSTVCREDFSLAMKALNNLASQKIWPIRRWRQALQVWSDDVFRVRSWQGASTLLTKMPATTLKEVAPSASWWFGAVSQSVVNQDQRLWRLADRFLSLEYEDGGGTDRAVGSALNHPVGQVTQGLLSHWFGSKPVDDQGLPGGLRKLFTKLLDATPVSLKHGRIFLATNVIALFRVDRAWCTNYVLPLFEWKRSNEQALAAWEGFLWSPRLYLPLFEAFKTDFLDTANHYQALGEYGRQYASILVYTALDVSGTFTKDELGAATAALPVAGLKTSAQALVNSIDGAGDKREEHWKNRIEPYWRAIWPKANELVSPLIADPLARLAIAAGEEFPDALRLIRPWLVSLRNADHCVRTLAGASLCRPYPETALELLSAIVSDQPFLPQELGNCLSEIGVAMPKLKSDPRYIRLADYLKKRQS
ncbi:hypothetical protein M2282_005954 [Variovorax boronicumulans]|uniref:hypothetical protein n=1 Tax=Variovorax boronicumulans TaxID=436515 RepID=UPI0024761F08|nr:hypothetical protein [Variovorax boronicumulans]MDH6170776.1 hypothetical protein [Variovorax boronicumulans]